MWWLIFVLSGRAFSIQIVDLIADDPDESELAFAAGDTLSIIFSGETQLPGHPGGLDRSAVDNLLEFSTPVVGDYWAHWYSNAVELRLTFGVVNASTAPVPGSFDVRCRRTGVLVAGAGVGAHPPAARGG